MGVDDKLILTYDAVPSAVPQARHAVTAFAARVGATESELAAIRLVTSEALTNVVVHAYGGGRGLLHVSAMAAGDELWVLVGDDGDGLHADSPRGGLGVGLALIAEETDSFAIVTQAAGGTEIQMRFTLARLAPLHRHREAQSGRSLSAAGVF